MVPRAVLLLSLTLLNALPGAALPAAKPSGAASASVRPSKIDLEIRYPVEKSMLIKVVNDIPDGPVQLADGVTWYLDPAWARDFDPITGRMGNAPKKTAGVLQSRRDESSKLIEYDARIYLHGEKNSVRGAYSTIIEPNGIMHEIAVSDSIGSAKEIDRVEFYRRTYRTARIDEVPVRFDLLPKKK